VNHRKIEGNSHTLTDSWTTWSALVAILFMFTWTLSCNTAHAEPESGTNALEGITFEALGYVDYSAGKKPAANMKETDYNRFQLTRGYLTLKKKVVGWMSVRITLDITQDETGDYKRREKYFYAELRPADMGFLTNMKSEIGIGHMPWLDFEEHVNPYRAQGTMPVERAGIFNSADAGVSLTGYFGEKMADAAERTGNSHYAGRYGSWHVGIYNGGGYHASEANENKVVEGRVTFRPLAGVAPGLQLSYLGLFGKGNVSSQGSTPDYMVNLGMVSYEHPEFTVTGQVFATEGNAKGNWLDPVTGDALKTLGYSVFGTAHIPGAERRLSVFGRFDSFDADADHVIAENTAYTMFMGGAAIDLHEGNMILVVFESTDYDENFGSAKGSVPAMGTKLGKDQKAQVVYQIKI
jgi:hypothetical protein